MVLLVEWELRSVYYSPEYKLENKLECKHGSLSGSIVTDLFVSKSVISFLHPYGLVVCRTSSYLYDIVNVGISTVFDYTVVEN